MPINNRKTLVTVHGYAGDSQQVHELLPMYEHHQCPIVILSPVDSPIEQVGGHIVRFAGERAYIGQKSWDRQWLQLKALLDYPEFDWFLLNDSDSFVLPAQLPDYLFDDPEVVYSNQVNDFRIPGETWTDANGSVTWPLDYHKGFPLIAMQPPYFLSRMGLERIVKTTEGMQACPITPFIDWWFVEASIRAGLKHRPFKDGQGASCETVTELGIAVMTERIKDHGAIFIHSVKSGAVKDQLVRVYNERIGS